MHAWSAWNSEVLPPPRLVRNLEHAKMAQARERMFGAAKYSYLRSALEAAVMLKTAPPEYLDRTGNRDYHSHVKAVNLEAYRREVHGPKAPAKPTTLKKAWFVLW
jgi:hypothetical protein